MEFSLTISKSYNLEDGNTFLITDSDMTRIQNAMAIPIADICVNNFGYEGQDRPTPWHALGGRYALEFHGGDTTPTLELSGDLKSSIAIQPSNGEYSRVYTDNEYASLHQWGVQGKLYARPFFPLVGDESNSELTPFAQSEATAAAASELERILSGK